MKGSKKQEFSIKVCCAKCRLVLYHYSKEGPGHLVKCYVDGIVKDNTKGDLKCQAICSVGYIS